jgi:hypothetical protein
MRLLRSIAANKLGQLRSWLVASAMYSLGRMFRYLSASSCASANASSNGVGPLYVAELCDELIGGGGRFIDAFEFKHQPRSKDRADMHAYLDLDTSHDVQNNSVRAIGTSSDA